jgi:hypothetical protein
MVSNLPCRNRTSSAPPLDVSTNVRTPLWVKGDVRPCPPARSGFRLDQTEIILPLFALA